MGTDRLIDRELPQWTKSVRRHAHFAQSLETEDLADAELDVQLEIIKAMSEKPAESPLDMLLKLKIWENFVAPNGDFGDASAEARLILSVIQDLERFADSAGGSMATYDQAPLPKAS